MFDLPLNLVLGLLSGIAFGILLQKGRVAKYHVIVGQFLLKDWTVLKVMLTAVAVGAIGVWAMIGMGMATLSIQPAAFGGVLVGAVLFGCGMAIFGYCPGTGVAACGEGRRDAMVGVVGMLGGALLYVAAFPTLQGLITGWGDAGKVTLPQLTGMSPWLYVIAIGVIALLVRVFAERPRPAAP
ncbi:YeeE/YedE thiosulfate transporter family protein [soil metagenome]